MRTLLIILGVILASVALAQQPTRITSGPVSVEAITTAGAITGFRLDVAQGEQKGSFAVSFGSVGNIVAQKVALRKEKGAQVLRFAPLVAEPTPKLGPDSFVEVGLFDNDPYPEVTFALKLVEFDQAAWEKAFGAGSGFGVRGSASTEGGIPLHFMVCSVPGAEIFHQRGWPIGTPVVDQYIQMQAEGPGRTIVSDWSRNWMYAPPIGAYPVPVAGLWKPSARQYIGYDFHEARLTDNSEKLIGTSYCWELGPDSAARNAAPPNGGGPDGPASHAAPPNGMREFFTLVWPYGKGYIGLRYPEKGDSFGTHFRLMWSLGLGPGDDPTRFVMERVWEKHKDLLPDAPTVNDVSWYPNHLRMRSFPDPRVGGLYGISGADARWEEPGAITAYGVGYTASPIDSAYRRKSQGEIDRLLKDIDFILPYTKRETVEGDECAFWEKPLEGEMAKMFGPGVGTIHTVQGWGVAQALLDTYRNDPQGQARLLPYIDGALRFTKHILYTRNDYPDVPAAQFCWGAGPVAHFCLSYHYAFRNDPARKDLADLALKLAQNMTYRNLPVWTSDSDRMDDIDSTYFMEPNAGLPWLGAACANEVWVVCHALAEVYVATGDPILGQYLNGMLERWHELAMDEYYPTIQEQDNRWAERYGLFEGAQQAKGTRASYGGIWGGFEELSWPIGDANVRVLCGEKSALVFTKGGAHTGLDRLNATWQGDFSFRLIGAGPQATRPAKLDVVVTAPFFDLNAKPVARQREGQATLLKAGTDFEVFPQRPDSILVRSLQHGDVVVIGRAPTGIGITPAVAKPRAVPETATAESGDFTLVNLAPVADAVVSMNWDDPKSMAGFPAGQRVIYGVPFELLDPNLLDGKAGVRTADIAVKQGGKALFVLARAERGGAQIDVGLAGGKHQTVELDSAVPVLTGWPPLFEWQIGLARLDLPAAPWSVTPKDATIFAVTVAGQKADLSETLAALKLKEEEVRARQQTVAGLKQLADLFEYFAGHIAVLPAPGQSSPQSSPLVKLMREAGMKDAVTALTPEQLVDPGYFTAERVWVTLYLGGEEYRNTVGTQGDVIASIRRYLHEGGTLIALPTAPFPFYYDETGKPNVRAAEVGLPINGSGVEGRRDQLPEAERMRISGWEKPPEGRQFTFHLNPDQQIITSLPKQFPFPTTGDPRWRPLANVVGQGNEYTPILTLQDDQGNSWGEGAAMIRYKEGPLAGGRVMYVWATLANSREYTPPIVIDLMRYVLTNTVPPPARALCYRADSPVTIDGKLDEAAWKSVSPLARFSCFGTKKGNPTYDTRAKVLWDDQNLYVGFQADDPDIWSTITQRDGNLWEGEVCEVYIDPDGDGRNYAELEVNPLNTVIDLKIGWEENGAVTDVPNFVKWDAEGWKTAVSVDGTPTDRADKDKSWTVEMAIPLKDLAPLGGPQPKIGDSWRFQLYRIDRSNTLKDPEYSGWSPTDTFHRPSQFGYLTFAGSPNADDFSLYPNGSSGAPMWRIANGGWRVVDGAFEGTDCVTPGWTPNGAVMADRAWQDSTLSLRFRIVSRGSDWRDGPWIGFRYSGADSCYSLDCSSRDIALHKAYAGQATGDTNALATAPFTPDNAWHALAVSVRGAQITATLDGQPLLQATDSNALGVGPVPAGSICLAARKWENSQGHTVVLFDDVKVTPE